MKNKKLFAILTLVCFLMTLMPVAAFADVVYPQHGELELIEDNDTVKVTEKVEVNYLAADGNGDYVQADAGYVYYWVTEGAKTTPCLGMTGENKSVKFNNVSFVEASTDTVNTKLPLTFAYAGEYTVHAAYVSKGDNPKVKDFGDLVEASNTVVIKATADKPEAYKNVKVVSTDDKVQANGLTNTWTLTLFGEKDKTEELLRKEAVSFEVNRPGLTVAPKADVTDFNGQIKVDLSATRAGKYVVTVKAADAEGTFDVIVKGNAATKIEFVEQDKDLVELKHGQVVKFKLKDIYNNTVNHAVATDIAVSLDTPKGADAKCIIADKDGNIVDENGIVTVNVPSLDKVGTYTLTAALVNGGSSAKTSWEVKEKGEAVKMELTVPETVVLGGSFPVTAEYSDANGLTTKVKFNEDVKYYVSGKAVANAGKGMVVAQSDEKYLGQEIVVTVIDRENDFTATAKVKVVEDSANIVFEDKALETYATNNVEWDFADAENNPVVLKNVKVDKNVEYYVLNKPAGATATAEAVGTPNGNGGTVAISCDKPGNVTVMAVAKVTTGKKGHAVTKFYTGTKVFAVGGVAVGDVVVMTIGTQTLVKNGQVTTMDATPIIKDNRTFVPFRALAEAFGARVNYNEADKTVTADLEGNTVVMTIGSNAYTVNGVAKTMDVAPYIDGSRTMVPVRFVAEAFGIDVTAVPDVTDGTTASVIFNK